MVDVEPKIVQLYMIGISIFAIQRTIKLLFIHQDLLASPHGIRLIESVLDPATLDETKGCRN